MQPKHTLFATPPRVTFRQMVEDLRVDAATAIWQRAVQFSKLRHLAVEKRRSKMARLCGERKAKLITRAARLAPEMVDVGPASDTNRVLSVRFRSCGRLHLPLRYVDFS